MKYRTWKWWDMGIPGKLSTFEVGGKSIPSAELMHTQQPEVHFWQCLQVLCDPGTIMHQVVQGVYVILSKSEKGELGAHHLSWTSPYTNLPPMSI